MNKSKIEWTDYTWNPITGCLNTCPYCYARRIAKRFSGGLEVREGVYAKWLNAPVTTPRADGSEHIEPYPYGFLPTLHRYRLGEPKSVKTPQNIFVCSMADLFGDWVPDEWIEEVFAACEAAPQHRYMFLTKYPDRYHELHRRDALPRSGNIWLGTTITRPSDKYAYFRNTPYKGFISVEPILECFGKPRALELPSWVILGAETGNRKGRVKPERQWINDIVAAFDCHGIPIFMKDSLLDIVGEDGMRREFPWKAAQ